MNEQSPALKIKKASDKINILSLSVVRRDGMITPFKSDKIFNAIKKAFLAQTKIRNNKDKDKEQKNKSNFEGEYVDFEDLNEDNT